MSNVVKFPGAAGVKKPATPSFSSVPVLPVDEFRKELLGYTSEFEFPGDQYLDQEFGAAISRESHDKLLRIYGMFGVTELDPSEEDFERALNTWYVLCGRVGMHLRLRAQFEKEAYAVIEPGLQPAYRDYLNALWSADAAGIAACARALGIEKGIPKDFPAFYSEG